MELVGESVKKKSLMRTRFWEEMCRKDFFIHSAPIDILLFQIALDLKFISN